MTDMSPAPLGMVQPPVRRSDQRWPLRVVIFVVGVQAAIYAVDWPGLGNDFRLCPASCGDIGGTGVFSVVSLVSPYFGLVVLAGAVPVCRNKRQPFSGRRPARSFTHPVVHWLPGRHAGSPNRNSQAAGAAADAPGWWGLLFIVGIGASAAATSNPSARSRLCLILT